MAAVKAEERRLLHARVAIDCFSQWRALHIGRQLDVDEFEQGCWQVNHLHETDAPFTSDAAARLADSFRLTRMPWLVYAGCIQPRPRLPKR